MKISITVEGLSPDEALLFLAANENATPPPSEKLAEAVTDAKADVKAQERIPPTPAVAKLLDEAGACWKDVEGTGKDGRITQQDVKVYLRKVGPEKETIVPKNGAVVPDSVNSGDKPEAGKEAGSRLTVEDARNALKALNSSQGMPACLKLLEQFGVKRVGDLAEKDYAAFIGSAG